jgi:hypothetical protein
VLRRWWFWAIVGVVVVAAGYSFATDPSPDGNSAASRSTPAQGSGKQESAAPAIGVPVVDDGLQFVVNSVACSTEPMTDDTWAPLEPNGQFCKVNVSVTALTNIGMYLGDITITTAQVSGEIEPAIGAMMYEGTLNADYISNGQTLTGDVVFDIAVDDSVETVVLKKTALSDGISVPTR